MPHWGYLSPQKILAAITAVVFAYINFRGASETGKVGNIITIAKISNINDFYRIRIKFSFSST